MEARQGRDAAGGSMRHAHDSATGHVSWPGTHSLQCLMHKLMRPSSGNRFDSDCRGLADPAQPVRRSLRGAKHRAAGIARRAFPWRQAKRAAHQARRYRQRAQQKKGAPPPQGRRTEGSAARSVRRRRRHRLQLVDHARLNEHASLLVRDRHVETPARTPCVADGPGGPCDIPARASCARRPASRCAADRIRPARKAVVGQFLISGQSPQPVAVWRSMLARRRLSNRTAPVSNACRKRGKHAVRGKCVICRS